MTQYFRFVPLAVTSALLATGVGACLGHSSELTDPQHNPGASSGGSTSSGATGGTDTGGTATGGTGTGGTGTGGTGTGGTGVSGTSACDMVTTQRWDAKTMPGYTAPRDSKVDPLVSNMNDSQKYYQMMGSNDGHDGNYNDIERSTDVTLNDGTIVRGYQYRDAGRGNNLAAPQVPERTSDNNNYSTVFPAESARAASWDTSLEYDLGEAMGDEVMASKNMMLLAPCMNIIRHPFWGRTQETYGEDMYHVGRMASALTAGIQQHVAACAKHFAANNVENGRQNQDAVMDEQTLREIYSKHFDMVVEDAGVACVMASYNKINGTKSTVNKHLLRDILKAPVAQGGMGFRGLVISDWWAMPGGQVTSLDSTQAQTNSIAAVNAGLDVEVPWWLNYGHLGEVVGKGVDISLINEAAGRILEQKFRFKQAIVGTDGYGLGTAKSALGMGTTAASIYNADHIQLAEDAEVKSAVLLQNGLTGAPAVLPFKNYANIAVIGANEDFTLQSTTNPRSCPATKGTCTFHFATDVALGDRGSSRVNADPMYSIGPWDGIKAIGANHGATNVTSGTSAADVGTADAVVVVVGLTPGDEGEEYALTTGGDRKSLDLPANQAQLVADVLALNKPTVIIVESGSIVNLPWVTDTAHPNQATIWAGYPGMHGGQALARLIFADQGANFSGKMPMAWPLKDTLAMQAFTESSQSTTMGYFFGYRFYDFKNVSDSTHLVYPFGRGLSYTTFKYDTLQVPCQQVGQNAIINVTANITNTGSVPGDEVALLFVKGPVAPSDASGAARPVKQLASFAKQHLEPGMSATVTLPVRIQDLKHWQGDANGKWVIDPGTYTVLVGPSGADADLTLMDTFTVQG